MVEMIETSAILHNATPRSLIILDEIGRGTSTYDGMAIARSVVEYLHNRPGLQAKTLFATHYHELVELAEHLPRVRNQNVAVAEEHGRIVFLRRVVPGGADRSYGVHVAELAGLPKAVVQRARDVLLELESGDGAGRAREAASAPQLSLFAATPPDDGLRREVAGIDVDAMTPLEALTRLYELRDRARSAAGEDATGRHNSTNGSSASSRRRASPRWRPPAPTARRTSRPSGIATRPATSSCPSTAGR
jgi:DNA mismatch repair protein MutS